jgi:hypothetical protein
MQDENKRETVATDVTGVVQEEVSTQEIVPEVADALPSTEVIDMVPVVDTAVSL